MSIIGEVTSGDVETLVWIIALGCLCGAAYMAYLRSAIGVLLFCAVAVVAVIVGTE